jgi:hypothetical protein
MSGQLQQQAVLLRQLLESFVRSIDVLLWSRKQQEQQASMPRASNIEGQWRISRKVKLPHIAPIHQTQCSADQTELQVIWLGLLRCISTY